MDGLKTPRPWHLAAAALVLLACDADATRPPPSADAPAPAEPPREPAASPAESLEHNAATPELAHDEAPSASFDTAKLDTAQLLVFRTATHCAFVEPDQPCELRWRGLFRSPEQPKFIECAFAEDPGLGDLTLAVGDIDSPGPGTGEYGRELPHCPAFREVERIDAVKHEITVVSTARVGSVRIGDPEARARAVTLPGQYLRIHSRYDSVWTASLPVTALSKFTAIPGLELMDHEGLRRLGRTRGDGSLPSRAAGNAGTFAPQVASPAKRTELGARPCVELGQESDSVFLQLVSIGDAEFGHFTFVAHRVGKTSYVRAATRGALLRAEVEMAGLVLDVPLSD